MARNRSSHKSAKTAKRKTKTPASEQNLAKNNAPPRSPRPKQRFVPLARIETIAADLHEGAGDATTLDAVTAKLEGLINERTAELTQVNATLRERITEHKRAEEALRESDHRLRQLLDTLPAAAYTCDADGLITYFNEEALRTWGRAPKLNDPVDRFEGALRLFSPDGVSVPHDRSWMAGALNEQRSVEGHEIVVERPDGSRRTFLAHVRPLRDSAGRMTGAVKVLVDVTERRRETQLLQTLLQETASVTGEQFFSAFVRTLATTLGVRYAIVTELQEGEPARLRMLAIWMGDRLGAPTEYDLLRTPCEKVITLGEACYQHSVQEVFPEDKDLAALGVVSYLGVAMRNSAGKTIGHVCLLDDKPIPDAHPDAQIFKVLKGFASRAATELEREQSQAALRESEERLRALYDDTPSMYFTVALDGTVLSVNRFGAQRLGYQPDELVGTPVSMIVHQDDREAVHYALAEAFANPTQLASLEFKIVTREGGVIWVRELVRILQAAGGTGPVAFILCEDITERKEAEVEQRRRMTLFHDQETALIELAKHPAIHGGELDSAVRAITEVAARILGVGRVGLWVYDEDRSAIRATDIYEAEQNRHSSGITLLARDYPAYFQALESERTAIEVHDAQTDPRTEEFSTSYLIPLGIGAMLDVPIRLKGEMVGVLCHEHVGGPRTWTADERTVAASLATMMTLALEGSEREHALGALRDSEERFRQLAENIQEVFWMSEPEKNRMLYISPTYERIWGRSCEDLYASPRAWLEAIHPEDLDRILRATLIKQAAGTYDEEYRIVRPDGAVRWIHDRAFPVHGPGDTMTRVVGVAEDVTQRRTLEEQLRQSVKMEAMGRLAGGIAHDFNNLLTVIDGYSAMLLDSGEIPNQLRGQLQEVKSAAERGSSLTRQLLAFSRRQIIQPMDVDLNQLVTRMIGMLQRLIGEDVNLVEDLEPELGLVRVDPSQFEQVIVNLAVNARDAMPSGGILTIETRKMDLAEPAENGPTRPPGPLVRLTVRDTGKGMDRETLARIFEPFFTTKEVGKGTGLGLSTVYGIVTHSKGTIEVASEPGRGASFAIFLTRQPDVARLVESVEPAARSLSGSETILLVEDATEVRSFMRDVLGTRGYQVLEAGNGAEALRLCEQHTGPVHLLISDVIMPGMGGPELADQAKAMRPMLKVLFISGYAGDETQCAHIQAMGAAFLQKPVAPTVLLSKTREVLGAGEVMA